MLERKQEMPSAIQQHENSTDKGTARGQRPNRAAFGRIDLPLRHVCRRSKAKRQSKAQPIVKRVRAKAASLPQQLTSIRSRISERLIIRHLVQT